MNTKQAYDQWSYQYDSNINRTRDLEAVAIRKTLSHIPPVDILEIGCGSGKNTEWLVTRANKLVAVDLSEGMLFKAKAKLPGINFIRADITEPWNFIDQQFDLITFSLVLEHIEDIGFIFAEAVQLLRPGGLIYIGELHPFKQYNGTKARFETETGTITVDCYTHHISELINKAKQYGLVLTDLQEWWDDDKKDDIPRILSLVLQFS
jgi:SAM-dependent methyltransferase